MLSRNNLYLSSLLLTLLGVVLFFVNVKELLDISGLLLLSILLMILPAMLVALNWDSYKLTRVQSFSLVIIPLIFLNYIYTIKMGVPVGFNDVYAHIFQYMQLFSNEGKIIFSNAIQISYNFVGLYIIFHFLVQISNLSIVSLASLVPPFFNIIVTILVYIIVNKIHTHRVALIAMMLFGWENQVLLFGHEMRTQTLGVLLIFMVLFFQYSNLKKSAYTTIILIILIFSIVTSSFVSIFYTFLLFLTILITPKILFSVLKWSKSEFFITWRLFSIFILFAISYLFYISQGFQNIVSSLFLLFIQMFSIETKESSFVPTGQAIYGDYAKFSTYIFWLIFLIFSIFYFIEFIKKKKMPNATFFVSFSLLLTYMLSNTSTGFFSSGRIYAIAFILMATVVAYGFVNMNDHAKMSSKKYAINIFTCIIIIIFITSSVVKMPNYIIGETVPMRSEAPIDSFPYWSSDLPKYAVGEFLSSVATNQLIHPDVLILSYFLLQSLKLNKASTINKGELLIFEDKFKGKNIPLNNLSPRYEDNNQFDKIYSNDNYVVFLRIRSF